MNDLDDLKFIISAPEGFTFGECISCKNPYLDDGTTDKCTWCLLNLHIDENEKEGF